MAAFTNLYCYARVILIISLVFLDLTSAINDEIHDNNTNETDILNREKRQITNRVILQRPNLQSSGQPFQTQSFFQGTCPYKAIGVACLPDTRYRTFDGTCNNLLNPWWGSAHIPFQRLLNANYADGQSLPRTLSVTGAPLPTPREVSNICSNEVGSSTENSVNAFFTTFAQFIDHDVSSVAAGLDDNSRSIKCQCQEQTPNPSCLNIATPDMPDQLCMIFSRSSALFQKNAACQLNVREQVNRINSFFDASMVYGSSKSKADQLRTFTKGQLRTTSNILPPQTTTGDEGSTCRDAQVGRACFLSGDTRSNENIGLTSFHTIFLRLHNQMALSLSEENPLWSDEILYQETRRIIIAILEQIIYHEYLPLVIGESLSNFGMYQYDSSIDPTISNEFTIGAYRFGHTLVNSFVRRFNSQHQMIDEIPLSQVIFRPTEAYNQQMGGVDTLIMGFLLTPASKFDIMVNDVMRNHLFEMTTSDGELRTKRFDLTSMDINRGRDHGLPTYNAMRQLCGLPRASTFMDLLSTMDSSAVQRLSSAYQHVDDIDFYIGGIAEKSISGGVVGPTFACVISSQFNNIRRGDRFFYETQDPSSRFTPNQLNEIRRVTLSSVLCQTVMGISEVQINALRMPNNLDNQHVACSSLPSINLSLWRE